MLTVILLSIAVSLLALILESRLRKQGRTPPGPFQWPVIGNLRLLRQLSREHRGQHKAFMELSRRYSSNLVSLRLGRTNVIVVSGYKQIQKVLGSEEFDFRPWNEFSKLRNMGFKKGITMNDGPEWKEVRAWLMKSLREVGFGRPLMTAHINNELQLLLDSLKDGGVVRMKSLLTLATLNVIWAMLTGKRFDENKLKNFNNLMERRAKAFDMSGGILSMFPWIRHIAPQASGYNVLVTLNNEIKSILTEVIEEHKRNFKAGQSGGDLIDLFLLEMNDRKENDSVFDDDQLFLILLDMLIAGSVTTMTTIDFLFLRMTVHQEVQRRLHEELDSVVGWDRLPDLNDRPKMPYTEAVITESQRMQLTVPIIGPRRVLQNCIMNGYEISKEDSVLINLWSVHMNPENFPNPDSFEPERFIKNGSHVPGEKLIFFGRGHRRCPGEAEARAAVFLFFVGVMQRFQLLPAPGQGTPDIEPSAGMTISPKPYQVLLVPRQRVSSARKCSTEDDLPNGRI